MGKDQSTLASFFLLPIPATPLIQLLSRRADCGGWQTTARLHRPAAGARSARRLAGSSGGARACMRGAPAPAAGARPTQERACRQGPGPGRRRQGHKAEAAPVGCRSSPHAMVGVVDRDGNFTRGNFTCGYEYGYEILPAGKVWVRILTRGYRKYNI